MMKIRNLGKKSLPSRRRAGDCAAIPCFQGAGSHRPVGLAPGEERGAEATMEELGLVMAAQFESFIDPFVILFSIPFGISGVLLGLLIMGKSLSMPAFLGMIILVGIVVNNAIVLIDYMKQIKERDSLSTHDALVIAGGKRLRPILMTAMTTIFGMVPMMLMNGEGAAMFSPMGTAVVFGLTVSTLITLILVPSVYAVVDSILVKLHLR